MKAVAFVWCQAKLDPHRVVAAVRRYHQQYLHDGRPAGLIHTIANAACARHLSTHSHWLLAPSWMLVQAWPASRSLAISLMNFRSASLQCTSSCQLKIVSPLLSLHLFPYLHIYTKKVHPKTGLEHANILNYSVYSSKLSRAYFILPLSQ
jgi:hypothetical protein